MLDVTLKNDVEPTVDEFDDAPLLVFGGDTISESLAFHAVKAGVNFRFQALKHPRF